MKRQRDEFEGSQPKGRSKYSAEDVDDSVLNEIAGLLLSPEETRAAAIEKFLERGYGARVIQVWTYYIATNNHAKIPGVQLRLAELIESCNAHPLLTPAGSALAKEIIEQHLKPIYRSLFACRPAPTKTAIKLLLALVEYQKGSLVPELAANVDFTLNAYSKILETHETRGNDESIRESFIRFYLSFIRHGNSSVRKDLISQRKIISGWLKRIAEDDEALIRDQLVTLRDCLLHDSAIPKTTKINFFSDWALGCFVKILARSDDASNQAADFLRIVATDSIRGIKFADNGWYPRDDDKGSGGIFNKVLVSLLKLLKPWEQDLQQDLAVDILRASPELVSVYMKMLNDSFSISPKLTAFWVGLMGFLARVISLPIPVLKHVRPPAAHLVCDNILPGILEKDNLTKCLKHESKLVQLLSMQAIIQVFKKLKTVEIYYRSKEWGFQDVHDEVGWRLPQFSTLVHLLGREGPLLRTTLFRALACYAEAYPTSLTGVPVLWDKIQHSGSGYQLLQVQDALSVQTLASGAGKWWNKLPNSSYSLFTSLLRLRVLHSKYFMSQTENILLDLVRPTLLFEQSGFVSPISILSNSLESIPQGKAFPSSHFTQTNRRSR
jgi:nucleolar pre-ribosomal-associated protein 1